MANARNDTLRRILEVAEEVYNAAGLLPHSLTEDVPVGSRGDLLADFIVAELTEVTIGYSPEEYDDAVAEAVAALRNAAQQLEAVADAIEQRF